MPCYATGSAEGDARLSAQEAQKEATAATRVACELVKTMRGHGLKKLLNQLSPATKAWIVEHDAKDAALKRQDAEIKLRAKHRAAALKKLTSEEKKALDL
jgi:hypothetical protein